MSLPDRFQPGSRAGRLLLSVCVLGMALIAGGCQVRPLYSTPSPTVTGSVNDNIRSKLASISINQPGDRVTQEVRNNLIFLFGGGAGEPTSPVYSLQLGISSRDLSLLLVQNATNDKSGQPTRKHRRRRRQRQAGPEVRLCAWLSHSSIEVGIRKDGQVQTAALN